MKTNNLITLLLLIVGMASCVKESVTNNDSATQTEETRLNAALQNLGFNPKTALIYGDTIVVDDDIIFYKSKLLAETSETIPRQAKAHTATLDKATLNIFIATNFTATERALIQSSINEFLTANLAVRGGAGFTAINYVTTQTNADAIIQLAALGSITCGRAEFPTTYNSQGRQLMTLGRNMYLNPSLYRSFLSSDSQRRELVVHEFGHMIGLRHTNWRERNEPETAAVDGQTVGAYLVPGTNNTAPNPDPASVFNAATCGIQWDGFSNPDVVAISHLTNAGFTL